MCKGQEVKRYNYKDHFDLLTIRHEYLKDMRKIDSSHIQHYHSTAKITAAAMYKKYYTSFNKVGFDESDILSLAYIYIVGYLANYGYRYHTQNYDRFISKFTSIHNRRPTLNEIDNGERNEIINFLRQRFQHCALNLCERKARNIVVGKSSVRHYAKTQDTKQADFDDIMAKPKKYGYRKVFKDELKEIKKNNMLDKDGYDVITIEKDMSAMDYFEYTNLLDSNNNYVRYNPESMLQYFQESKLMDRKINKFHSLSYSEKAQVLKKFISTNRSNKSIRKELAVAKKLYRKYIFWHE